MIHGLDNAKRMAADRVLRTKEAICIVKVAEDTYVLWREKTIHGVALVYRNAYVVSTVRIKQQ